MNLSNDTGSDCTSSTKSRFIRFLAACVLFTCIAGYLCVILLFRDQAGGPSLVFVMLLAVLGSTVDVATRPWQFRGASLWQAAVLELFWKLSVASILAVILYCMFAAGILQGSLFPEFMGGEVAFSSMHSFFTDVVPKTNSDCAKVLFWSFIAGYSERYVHKFLQSAIDASGPSHKDERPQGGIAG